MSAVAAVFRREFAAYFATPIAFVFLIIFLFSMGVFTFYVGNFYDNGVADLSVFFSFQPWLYLFLIPALAMRLWAEERRSGIIELLLTLPLPVWATVLGKYLAAWAFAGLALALTFPIWITVNYLGHPDNGVILASYIGSFLMAGRLSVHRRGDFGGDQQPGDRLCGHAGGLLSVHRGGRAGGDGRLSGLGAGAAGGCGVVFQLPHPFHRHFGRGD